MKKTLFAILALTLVFSMASCSDNKEDPKDTTAAVTDAVTETDAPSTSTPDISTPDTDVPADETAGALGIIETVWNAIPEDGKFYCVGGSFDAGTAVENAPGDFGVSDAAAVDNSLGFPAASISMIDEAANLIHGMNANNFTMAAYHLTDVSNLDAAVKAIDENLTNRNWMCGFPEVLKIVTVNDEYVISIFGAAEIIDPVMAQISASYPTAVVALDKSLME